MKGEYIMNDTRNQSIEQFFENIFKIITSGDNTPGDLARIFHGIRTIYELGTEDAWQCAKQVEAMSEREIEKCGLKSHYHVFNEMTALEAIFKIKEYNEKEDNDIKLWDEVELDDGVGEKAIIVKILPSQKCDDYYHLLGENINMTTSARNFTKTGKNFAEFVKGISEFYHYNIGH